MAFATRADSLPAPPPGLPGAGGLAPAGPCGWLAALFAPAALPAPQLQIRSFGAGYAAGLAPAGVGQLAHPGGPPTAGPLTTPNYLRLSWAAPLPAAVLAARPALWLFTHHHGWPAPAAALPPAGWHHPAHLSGPHAAPTEFGGAAVQQGLGLGLPSVTLVLDANHWVGGGPGQAPCPPGKPGKQGPGRRFRFALVVEAPTPSGRRMGPLSSEVWLAPQPQPHAYAFRAPAPTSLYS